MAMHYISDPYARGILKIAPVKVSVEDASLSAYTIQDQLDLLEPLTDIIDICGINPTAITFSVNTLSSEATGRDEGLNMHRDILGRVRDFQVAFPPLTHTRYSQLKSFLLDKTETITSKEIDTTGSQSVAIEVQTKEYVIWWLIEILLPDSETAVREVVYLGDSSFTGIEIDYQTKVVNAFDNEGRVTDYYNEVTTIIAKNVKVNFGGKTKIDPNME